MDDEKIFPFRPDERFDLFAATEPELDRFGAGAYVLLRAREGAFEYPTAHSRVFYIGESSRGGSRLATHRYHATRAKLQLGAGGPFSSYWWPRYGFAAAFGAEVWWFKAQDKYPPKKLESLLVDRFFWKCGALPIGNGKWPNASFQDPNEELE